MALNIKNRAVEQLAAEVAAMAHETKTEAIRKALVNRKTELQTTNGTAAGPKGLREFFEREIWPHIPPSELGRKMTREEEDEILGYGPDGV
jgi:antitoxin VapB